jgi:hypothetical protein
MRTDAARLSCPGCRLAYNPAAVARVQALVAGAACPRCGERLQWEHDDADAQSRSVRAAVTGAPLHPETQ